MRDICGSWLRLQRGRIAQSAIRLPLALYLELLSIHSVRIRDTSSRLPRLNEKAVKPGTLGVILAAYEKED